MITPDNFPQQFRKIVCIVVLFLALAGMLPAPAHAEDAFRITIQVFYERGDDRNIYYEPAGNFIRVRPGPARPFKVVLRNITSNTQVLRVDEASRGLNLITFEITDENGNNNIVTKKIDLSKSRSEGYNNIAPGKTKEFEIILTEKEWDNSFKMLKQGVSKVKVRASYRNGSTIIYSDYYTVIL
jgi:hypothetical protein